MTDRSSLLKIQGSLYMEFTPKDELTMLHIPVSDWLECYPTAELSVTYLQ